METRLDTATFDHVARARVFFAHQSVGDDILDGVRTLLAPRRIEWTSAHVGRNGEPFGKLEAFRRAFESGTDRGASISMLKLCYGDFDARTDVAALFASYRTTMRELARARPHTTFVHVTAPLTTVGAGPRAWLQTRLGMPVWGEIENGRRDRYNELLRRAYGGREPVFDLAAVEAGASSASGRVPALSGNLTYDGGHLNPLGRSRAAAELVRLLSGIVPTHGEELRDAS